MMQAKRIIISLLVVVLLTFCSLTAFAATEQAPAFKVAVSAQCDTAIAEGDYAYGLEKDAVVKFSIASGDWSGSIYAIKLEVKYDASALELVSDENGSVHFSSDYGSVASVTRDEAGVLELSYVLRSHGYQGAGELVNFSFKVKDTHTNVGEEAVVTVNARVISGDQSLGYPDLPVEVDGTEFSFGVHTYGEEQARDLVPNDCTAGAEIFRACTVEGCVKDSVIARPNEASHDESGAAPNCTTAKICAREGCTHELAPKLGHAPNIEQATCMTDLFCTREDCPNKGEVLQEKLPHDASGPDATCMSPKLCKYGCGTVLAELPHDATGPDATCMEPKVCKYGCGTVLAPKIPHDTTGPDADCENPKVCKYGCGTVLAPKLGHDASGPAVDCLNDKVCAREGCGAVLAEALGHDESGKPATCTTDKVCARPGCNFVIEERFGHDESGAAATCARPKVCVTCGEVLVPKLDSPDAHVYGEWVVETEATMSSTGLQVKVCTLCENKITEEIPEKSAAWLIILIIVGVLVLAGGGFAAYWFLIKNKKANAESEETTEENSEGATEEATEAPAEEATEEKTEE